MNQKVFYDTTQPDSLRMVTCKKIGFHYTSRDKDSAFHYADNLLSLAERVVNEKYVGYCKKHRKESFDSLMKRFKKSCEKDDIINVYKEQEFLMD